jgi:hypothetical protein
MSFAAAENKAKTEECYGLYKKAKYVYELASEQVMLIKKIIGARQGEFNQMQ